MAKTSKTKISGFRIVNTPSAPMTESLKEAIRAEIAMEKRSAEFLKDKTITLGPWPPKEWVE
jgi:hypothetical protein